MPYSKKHSEVTRDRIIESARILFNRHGFEDTSIEMIMANADLTRGGFYNHFKSKDEIFALAVRKFLTGRGAQWRSEAGVDTTQLKPETATQLIDGYLSNEHLEDLEGQCPMIALPSDVARNKPEVKESYQQLLNAMVWLFESCLEEYSEDARTKALSTAALCVGGMVLARTLPDSGLAEEVRSAAHTTATQIIKG